MSSNVISLHTKRNKLDCQGEPYFVTPEAEAERRRLELIQNCKERIAADAQLLMLASDKALLMRYLTNLLDHFQGGRK